MRKILLASFTLLMLFLFSCQKEIEFSNAGNNSGNNNGNNNNNSGTLLVKTVSKSGTDSVVTVYSYNSNKQLINQKISGIQQGIDASNEYRYYRNTSGIVTHYVQINPSFVMAGIDSITTFVHYNTSNSKYTSSVSEFGLSGFSVLDSSVFVYDAGGKVTRYDQYQSIPFLGTGYELTIKFKYTYASNGNLTQYDLYDASSGSDDLVGMVKYTFDTKTSPLILNNEAFAIGHPDWVSVNNGTKAEIIDPSDPSNNEVLILAYTYNSNNRPAKCTITHNPAGTVENVTYYYQ